MADSTVDQGRRQGVLEAEQFDQELRRMEQREREERLGVLAAGGGDPVEGIGTLPPDEAAHLRRQIERLSAFHQGVINSRAWKLIQAVRRPLGRAW